MRRFRLAVILGIFAIGFAVPPALAAGNVLLPSDDDSSSSGADLGLGPAPAEKSDGNAAQNHPSEPTLLPEAETSKNVPATISTLGYTPIPASAPGIVRPPSLAMPTKVIDMPVPEATSNASQADLPANLTVAMADKYGWGSMDLYLISNGLGIPNDQIPAHCHISVNGSLESDAGYFPFDTGPTQSQAPVRYAGTVKDVILRAAAMCDKLPLPPNAGYVFASGDKYVYALGQITCAPPPPNAQRLVFYYAGNAAGQCAYQ
jgi:hypothetical protein